ncbi:hypothetical protein ACE6H2_016311 [Prunus campanulata]
MKTTGSNLILLVTMCCHESVVLPMVISKISIGDLGWGIGFADCTRRFLYRSSFLMFRPLP